MLEQLPVAHALVISVVLQVGLVLLVLLVLPLQQVLPVGAQETLELGRAPFEQHHRNQRVFPISVSIQFLPIV